MPRNKFPTIDVDWSLVEAHYYLFHPVGGEVKFICETFDINEHTLRSKIRRGNWKANKEAVIKSIRKESMMRLWANTAEHYTSILMKKLSEASVVLEDVEVTEENMTTYLRQLKAYNDLMKQVFGTDKVKEAQSRMSEMQIDKSKLAAE